jgi:hypothetical protein
MTVIVAPSELTALDALEALDEVGVVFGGLVGVEPCAAVATKVSMRIAHVYQSPSVSSAEAVAASELVDGAVAAWAS